jgi:hypothetical protein
MSFFARAWRTQKCQSPLAISCRKCGLDGPEGTARAFFSSTPSITLCIDRLKTADVEEALTHELVHGYDVRSVYKSDASIRYLLIT